MKRIFLYGIAGVEDRYKVVKYLWIEDEEKLDVIKRMRTNALWMKYKNPSIEHVYAMCESAELARSFKHTIGNDSIEMNVLFKVLCEKEGILII